MDSANLGILIEKAFISHVINFNLGGLSPVIKSNECLIQIIILSHDPVKLFGQQVKNARQEAVRALVSRRETEMQSDRLAIELQRVRLALKVNVTLSFYLVLKDSFIEIVHYTLQEIR